MDKYLLRRVKILNIAIILLLLISFSGNFLKGFIAGWDMAKYQLKENVSASLYQVKLEPTSPTFGMPINNGGSQHGYLSVREGLLMLVNIPKSHSIATIATVVMFLALAILIYLIVLIWKTTNLIGRGEMMSPKVILRARLIGVLLIVNELLTILLQYVEARYINSTFSIEGYKVVVDYWSVSLVVGLVMLVIAEILTVANRIREEQELTI